MRVVREEDVEVFADPSGDTLTLLAAVRQKDAEHSDELEGQEAIAALSSLGMSMEEAMKQAREASPEQTEKALEQVKDAPKSAKIRRFRFMALARAANVGGTSYGRSALGDLYDSVDRESAAWIDAQVETVWARATPDDEEKHRAGAGVGVPVYPVSSPYQPPAGTPGDSAGSFQLQPLPDA